MAILQVVPIIFTISGAVYIYFYLMKNRKLYDDRISMTIAIVCSSSSSFLFGLHAILLFQVDVPLMMIVSGVAGIIAGLFYGSLSKMQFALVGMFNGVMSGFMGAMAGGVLLNPSLCGLPWNEAEIQQNIIIYSSFATFLVGITFILLLYSFRV